MNANKKTTSMNSGWILCPSKTFPGKFYYFNVLNGETAWSLGDAEKKIIKKDGNIPKVTGSHHHPEPTSPPTSDPISNTLTPSSQQPSFSLMKHPTPVFGQSVFPRPLPSKQEEPNVIWTPIQIQVPIVLAPESTVPANEVTPACVVKESQFYSKLVKPKPALEFAKDMIVHACDKPLSHRFVNYENPVINFDKNNKIKDKKQFEKFYTSTPIKKTFKISAPTFKNIAANTDQIFQSKNNLSFSDLKPKTSQKKNLIQQSIFNIEVPSKTPEKVFGSHENKLKHAEPKDDGNKAGIAAAGSGMLNSSGNDLRMLLLAKKRKSSDSRVSTSTGEFESKRTKTIRQESTPQPKKRVTFNLDHEEFPRIEHEDDYVDFKEKYSETVQTLKDLAGPGMRSDKWCIVVDAEVLLEEFSFLESFVQIDPYCKLVVPPSVHAAVCAVARGDCRGRARVTVARHLVRKLPNAYTIVQSADGEGMNSPPNDAILKSCVEAMDQNIHVILITDDQELRTTANCYPIHCYSMQNIKNGLAPKPKATGYKQMKITIQNDTDSMFTQNRPEFNERNLFENDEDLNEKEKEILRNFKQSVPTNVNESTPVLNEISNEYPISTLNFGNSIENPKLMVTLNKNISNSEISKQNPMISNTDLFVSIHQNSTINSNDKSKITNTNSKISVDHSTIANITETNTLISTNSVISNKNSRITNENSRISDTNALTEWRYAASDVTETTIEVDMQKLNLKEKPFYQQKTLINNTTTRKDDQEGESVSYFFQKPTPKLDFRKSVPHSSYFQNGKKKTIDKDSSIFEIESGKPKDKTIFEMEKGNVFEKNKSKQPVFEMGKEKKQSIFEIDVFKKPQSVMRKNTNIDLSQFYVKNKVMENRLEERMDEWVCSFIQVMEESLTGVLEKLSSTVPKSMTAPWSLYEALQCAKTVFKDHIMMKSIADELCGFLYESDYRTDKLKRNIIPNEFIKAFGCGVQLIKYLKKILQHSVELLEAEESLQNMLKQIENPLSDISEPLVKTPVVSKADDREVRQNFVKNRSEIVNYLKKHYTEWQNYDETENYKLKIIRTFGRDLNLLKLDKKVGNKEIERNDNIKVGNATRNADVSTKNVDVGTKNVDVATKSVVATKKYAATGINVDTLELAKVKATFDTKKNVDDGAMRRVAGYIEPEHTKMKLMQIKNDFKNAGKLANSHKNTPILTKTIDKINSQDNVKPEQSSIFDYVIPKKAKKYLENQEEIDNKYVQRERFKIDSKMLDVKITVPNDYKLNLQNNGEFCKENYIHKRTDNVIINENTSKHTKEIDKRFDPVESQKNLNCPKVIGKGNENGPKIVRNVHLIEEFENRLKTRESLDLDELDYSPDSIYDDDDDATHYSNTDDHDGANEIYVDNSDNATKNENDISENTADVNDINRDGNDYDHIKNAKDVTENDFKVGKVIKTKLNKSNYLKNDMIHGRKFDKDDMTNDSGFGNESPHVYSVVKSFSSELEGSLDLIRTLIDDSLQDFREGEVREKTKKQLRQKAFEASFLITKIIIRLNKFVQREGAPNEDSNKNHVSKNTVAVVVCLQHAQLLQKALHMILSVTNEGGSLTDPNSSMSLNLST